MPDFEVTSPTGQKFIVTAPDGATQDQILSYARQNMPQAGAAPDAAPEDQGDTGATVMVQGQKRGRLEREPPSRLPVRKVTQGDAADLSDERVGSGAILPVTTYLGQKRRIERAPGGTRLDLLRAGPIGGLYEGGQTVMDLLHGRRPVEDIGPLEAAGLAAMGVGGSAIGRAGIAGESLRVPRPGMPRGAAATRTVEQLRQDALARAGGAAGTEESAAAAAARRGEAATRSQQQIEEGRAIAEARSRRAQPVAQMGAERQQVLADLREKARVLQRAHQEAGMNVGDAQRQVALNERQIGDAEQAVAALEQELLQRPTMTADEFGTKIRTVTQQIADKYSTIRSQQSGFKKAIEDAGDAPRVNTQPTRALIDAHLKDVRNPQLQSVLESIRDLMETEQRDPANPKGTVRIPALSIRAADSARGYLDSIIRSKQVGDRKIDRETLFIVKQIKKALVESATQAYQPYRDALAKWRTLSRPLDIVERKGALRKVIDTDPVSTDYALSEAKVVGQVLQGARAGNPTLTRLIAEDPGLKDAARLHFTQDLFSREQVPSVASLRTWLKNNERALKQTGLYSEFRDIRVARDTAARAVQEAKGQRAGSFDQLKAAEKAERAAADELSTAERLRQKQQARIAAAEKGAEAEGTDRSVISTRKVQTARQRLTEQQKTAQTEGAKRKAVADQYRQFEAEIRTARPEQVPTQARTLIKRLRDDGRLNDTQYEELLTRVQHAEDKITDRAARIKRIKQIVRWGALIGLGYEVGREGVSSLIGR